MKNGAVHVIKRDVVGESQQFSRQKEFLFVTRRAYYMQGALIQSCQE